MKLLEMMSKPITKSTLWTTMLSMVVGLSVFAALLATGNGPILSLLGLALTSIGLAVLFVWAESCGKDRE